LYVEVRLSITEPKLRLNAEAENIDLLDNLVKKIRNIIEE